MERRERMQSQRVEGSFFTLKKVLHRKKKSSKKYRNLRFNGLSYGLPRESIVVQRSIF